MLLLKLIIFSFYSYDSTGTSLLSVSDGDAILEYVYNDNGDLISATDRYGTRSSISYNENSWIDRIERFDSNSELLSSTGLTITWSGRVDIFFSPDNTSRTLIHDRLGNVVSTASNNGLPVVTVELPFGRRVLLGDEVRDILNTHLGHLRRVLVDIHNLYFIVVCSLKASCSLN